MNGGGMSTNSFEVNDNKRRKLEREMKETKSRKRLVECKKEILLLDREDILRDLEIEKTRTENKVKDLKQELKELDRALEEYQ